MQQASISTLVYLPRISEIVTNYFSPWFAHYKRTLINDTKIFLRNNNDIF